MSVATWTIEQGMRIRYEKDEEKVSLLHFMEFREKKRRNLTDKLYRTNQTEHDLPPR